MSGRFGIVLVLVFGAVMACGKAPEGDGVASAGGATPSATAARDLVAEQRRWAQCMRGQGIDMPDPDPVQKKITGFEFPAKGTAEADKFAQAEQACIAFFTFNDAGGERKPLSADALTAWRTWAQCMRDNGVDQPDPGPLGFEPDDEQGRGDPATEALKDKASEACFEKFLTARQVEAGQ